MKTYHFEGIEKSFGAKAVLNGVGAEFAAGSMVGLLGLNGSGKTTLLNILGNVDRDYSGTVSLRGNRVAFMQCQNPFTSWWKVKQVLAFYRRFYQFDETRAEQFLATAGIGLHTRVASLSAGMQRQLMFIVNFCVDSDVLLMDEPLTNLDVQFRSVITDALIDCALTDRIIVVATHEIKEFENLFTHVAILKDGKIGQVVETEEIRATGRSVEEYYKESVQ